ncbi:MAG TPA: bifunctional metallophosphatase/5'-nucleotidase [Acidimicrobiales bacterium]|jgi:5'-nucleotidase|nr:bifunctional metallophosphatase/5'-nucleotidase [Acidimicrobiales bacterium]
MGRTRRSWIAQAAVAALALGVVLTAPLASSDRTPAGAVTISGARSLSDQVVVSYGGDARETRTTDVHLLAFNDLHGNLEAAGNNIYGQFAGGAAYLAKAVKDRQALYGDHQATLFAGDNIGASPLANGLFFEEPITIASNLMNVDFASVGNHEFDKGSAELLRIQNGGCHADGCTAAPYALPDGSTTDVYPGADFQYLSANVVVDATGRTLFPAFGTQRFKSDSGKKFTVGFIGEVLEATPTIVTPTGVAGLTFQDEADAANRAARQLERQGVDTSVLVIHEGGFQTTGAALNGCAGNLAGSAIADIASRLDPSIKVIVSAHTHAEYRCTITAGGVTRLITSASSFGRILTDITLTVDDKTGELVQASAENVIVGNALNTPAPGVTRIPDPSREDPQVQAVVDQYVAAAAPLANRVIGRIQGDLTRTASPLGESALGDVIADVQHVATQPADLGGAQLAFMNPGGIRADLRVADISSGGEAPGEVTYGEAFTVQPFGNSLVTKTMTGDMIRRLLEQQFPGCGGQTTQRILQVSSSFRYEQSPGASTCAGRIGRILVGGVEMTPTDSFRVTMNSFLAAGGDGFTVFNEGTDALGGAQDIDALVAAFAAAEPAGIAVPALDRIVAPVP